MCAFVCLCPFVSDGPSICLCPTVPRGLGVCRLFLSCVDLGCLVLSCLGLSCLAWSCLCVTSLCAPVRLCLFVAFTLPLVLLCSFVLWLFRSFFLFFVPSLAQGVSCWSFSHANANKVKQLTVGRSMTAAPPFLSKEHTARTRDPVKYVLG